MREARSGIIFFSSYRFKRLCEIIRLRGGKLNKAERRPRPRERCIDAILDISAPVTEKLVDAIEGAGYDIDLILYQP